MGDILVQFPAAVLHEVAGMVEHHNSFEQAQLIIQLLEENAVAFAQAYRHVGSQSEVLNLAAQRLAHVRPKSLHRGGRVVVIVVQTLAQEHQRIYRAQVKVLVERRGAAHFCHHCINKLGGKLRALPGQVVADATEFYQGTGVGEGHAGAAHAQPAGVDAQHGDPRRRIDVIFLGKTGQQLVHRRLAKRAGCFHARGQRNRQGK